MTRASSDSKPTSKLCVSGAREEGDIRYSPVVSASRSSVLIGSHLWQFSFRVGGSSRSRSLHLLTVWLLNRGRFSATFDYNPLCDPTPPLFIGRDVSRGECGMHRSRGSAI